MPGRAAELVRQHGDLLKRDRQANAATFFGEGLTEELAPPLLATEPQFCTPRRPFKAARATTAWQTTTRNAFLPLGQAEEKQSEAESADGAATQEGLEIPPAAPPTSRPDSTRRVGTR